MMQEQTSSNNKINQAIDTCNPDLLIEAILHASVKLESDRNNVKLLGKIKDVFGKGVTAVNHKLAEIDRSETANQAKAAGDAIIEIPDATFLEPRGKFSCSMSMSGIHLNGSGATKVSCFIPLDLISHMALVPNNATTKKEGEDYLCIRLSQPVKCNGKDLKSFLWVLGKAEAKQPPPPSSTSAECKVEAINAAEDTAAKENSGPKTESDKVSTILASLCSDIKLIKPNVDLFKSLTKQKSYVNCYKGIQEGVLYPLENGLLFVKPMLFIPFEEILSMVAGRGGGSNTRFVDLIVETSDKKETEFTNFEREELGSLQWYIDWLKRIQRKKLAALEAVKAETSSSAKKGENAKEKSDNSMESTSTDKKDDDIDDDGSSDDDDSDASEDNKGGYFKDVEDSDDEDDDDFNPDGGSSDGSGSDSSDNSSDDGSVFSGSWDGSDSGDSIEKKIKSKSKSKRSLDNGDDTGSEDDDDDDDDDSNSKSNKPAKKRPRDTASK